MKFFDNHVKLFSATAAMFIGLTLLVCIIPALKNDKNFNHPLPGAKPLTALEQRGKDLYIANGCVGCHSQQVRDAYMDKTWGARPSIAADYALIKRTDIWRNTATLMGTERTGPDLTDIGNRNGSQAWNLLHLYNPRAVVAQSVMPAFPWLFEVKQKPGEKDVVVNVPEEFMKGINGKVVATKDAIALVAYLQSLKQIKLPDGSVPSFIYKTQSKATASSSGGASGSSEAGEGGGGAELDGAALYSTYCQSCHQANGEGLEGAFPALKGSGVVLNNDAPDFMVNIIMNGYNGRASEGYGPMPNIGTAQNLTAEEVTAIMNHEKTSWGNNAEKVSVEDVKKWMEEAKSSATN